MIRIGSISIGFAGWVVVGACLAALSPSAAQAACAQWNTSGQWQLTQSNGVDVELQLQQNGNVVTGSAKWLEIIDNGILVSDEKWHYGSVDGTVDGNSFSVQMYWSTDRTIGVYTGEIGPQGRIEGRTYERAHPANQASWFSGATMTCAAQESAQATQPKPIRKLGKKKPAQTNGPTVLQGADLGSVIVQPAESATGKNSAVVTEMGGLAAVVNQTATCKSGYVWREVRPEDVVCVTPAARARTAEENRLAPERRDPAGAYGPNTCISGFVWREAFAGDVVCVTPDIRNLVREENRLGASRRVGG